MDETLPCGGPDNGLGETALSSNGPADRGRAVDPAKSVSRRRVMQTGAGVVAALAGVARGSAPALARDIISIPRAPNIVVLMTDQERHHMHWPPAWAEKNLPGLQRLKRNGLYFNRAYTAACQCRLLAR